MLFDKQVDATITFFIVCSVHNVVFSIPPRVQTTSGLIEGYRHSGVDVYFGIPYAQPPIGSLRFRQPEPVKNWSDIHNAIHPRPSCYQELNILYDSFGYLRPEVAIKMSEDCLYLDIWVPEVKNRARLATMVWFHGDKFGVELKKFASYDGRFLASEYGVILVSVSYRVGALGFLYAENMTVSGNMGIHDQAIALKWLYKNIEHFGGDRYKITLFGEGKGASYISFHLLSPVTSRYVNNAILQSGSVLSPLFFQHKSDALLHTKRLARKVGCPHDPSVKMIDCLTNIDITKLIKEEYIDSGKGKRIGAHPVRDETISLSESSGDILRTNKVKKAQIMVGIRPNEMRKMFIRNRHKYLRIYVETSQNTLTYFERTLEILVPINNNITREAITEIYLGSVLLPEEPDYTGVLEDIGGDFNVKCPTLDLAKEYTRIFNETNSIFVYSYNNPIRYSKHYEENYIGDEVDMVFGIPFLFPSNYTDSQRSLSNSIMQFWTNFAKMGNPNGLRRHKQKVAWPPYKLHEQKHIILTEGVTFGIGSGLGLGKCSFWKKLYPKLNAIHDTLCSGASTALVATWILVVIGRLV